MNKKRKRAFRVAGKLIAMLFAVMLLASSVQNDLFSSMFTVNANNSEQEEKKKVVAVAVGSSHTMVLKEDGTVWTWGNNISGQLGDGSTINRSEPVQVVGLNNIIAISAGSNYCLALEEDGTVWAWGDNWSGQLGNGTTTNSLVPVKSLTDIHQHKVKSISAGCYNSMAITETKALLGWGDNLSRLGTVTNGSSNYPFELTILNNVKATSQSDLNYLVLTEDGNVWSWGSNRYGNVGDGSGFDFDFPILLETLSDVKAVTQGIYNRSMVLKGDGTVWTWGEGNLGNGSNRVSFVPIQVPGLSGVEAIAAGTANYVIKSDGSVWGWGNNYRGSLGDGTDIARTAPVHISGISNVKMIDAGYNFAVALDQDGSVWTWGDNQYGQLGDGETGTVRQEPYCVYTPDPGPDPDNTDPENPLMIRLDQRVQGEIEKIDEARYYSFTPANTDTYVIQCISDLDTYGEVFDSSGLLIAWNDDGMGRGESGNLRDFYISKELTANQTYLIRVNALEEGIGEFVLRVSK